MSRTRRFRRVTNTIAPLLVIAELAARVLETWSLMA
jgi:hypothetical protein